MVERLLVSGERNATKSNQVDFLRTQPLRLYSANPKNSIPPTNGHAPMSNNLRQLPLFQAPVYDKQRTLLKHATLQIPNRPLSTNLLLVSVTILQEHLLTVALHSIYIPPSPNAHLPRQRTNLSQPNASIFKKTYLMTRTPQHFQRLTALYYNRKNLSRRMRV